MARAEWTLTAEDELTELAYWIAVEDERPLTARRIVEEIQQKAENYADVLRVVDGSRDFPRLFP